MKCCKTCKWARWERTAKGGIRTSKAGRCEYPKLKVEDVDIKIPDSSAESKSIAVDRINVRFYIWSDRGRNCECYELKP